MTIPFYPKHEYACPNLGCCPHLGGASIATVVQLANHSQQNRADRLREIRVLEAENSRLRTEVVQLQDQLAQAKLELKLERQNKFTTNKQQQSESPPVAIAADQSKQEAKKRGAPKDHPGWFRPTPTEYDWAVDVAAPRKCPDCRSAVTLVPGMEPSEHLQEDILDGQYRVVLYRHEVGRCSGCGQFVEQAGKDEILGVRIGPHLRSKAIYLRNVIGISYRKVPRAIEEFFGITFTPAALLSFEKVLGDHATPVVDDIAKKLASSDGAVHADETFWKLNGEHSYFWVHGDEKFIHFQFDTSRAGQVSRDILGDDFKFFQSVREFVTRGCRFHRRRNANKLNERAKKAEIAWLKTELERLASCDVTHEKAVTLQGRILRHLCEWLVFVDDPRVPPTNNLAERALRPLVVLRKTSFGSRSKTSAQRMAKIMTIAETAKRHGHKPSDIFLGLYTRPPDKVMQELYANA